MTALMTVEEALLRHDVTSAAWRLMLDAAYGQQIHRRAARRTLLAAGADLESATEWTELAADIARSARKAAKAAKTPTPARRAKTVMRPDQCERRSPTQKARPRNVTSPITNDPST
ncbi:hypothetical protein FZI97_29960 [Mycobacterium sp. CBMA360]|uniref:hypothetical protein n=1 Tax=Mycolicibacterium sp. TaxID=2320850 RepID=UPI0013171763|nr:hypothetical protein [Mycolicibacterium sp. CBMA 360]MUM05017.1 hypothetical protein [Mycolicibacterium sp. CBMA 213]QGT51753.1 hypothetical protein pCBMA213_3_00011 [Mycolicibacterium sp.]